MTLQDHIREIRKHLYEIERPYLGGAIRASITVGEKPSAPMKDCPLCRGDIHTCRRCNGTGKVVAT